MNIDKDIQDNRSNQDNQFNQDNQDNRSNQINKDVIEKLASWVECICCFPITLYGLYLGCKNPSYKYEPILDQPTIEALVDHYI